MPAGRHEPLLALPLPRRPRRGKWLVCLASLLLALSGSDNAVSGADPTLNEIEVTSRARHALVAEPRLASYNLFVTVQQGVATVRGPLPSRELIRSAVKIVEQVRGVYEVRNKLTLVAPPTEPPFVVPLGNAPPIHSESALPDRNPASLGGILAGRTGKNPPEAGKKPAQDLAPNPFPAAKATKSSQGVTLLTPVGLPEGTVVAPQTVPEVDPVAVLRSAVEQLRRKEQRFRPLQAEIRDARTIWVYDDPWRGDDVAAFSEGLRRLPGVKAVVIKNASSGLPK